MPLGNIIAIITQETGPANSWVVIVERFTLNVDNKQAIVALAQDVTSQRLHMGSTTLMEHPQPEESHISFHAESGAKSAEGILRTIRNDVEHRLEVSVPAAAVITAQVLVPLDLLLAIRDSAHLGSCLRCDPLAALLRRGCWLHRRPP